MVDRYGIYVRRTGYWLMAEPPEGSRQHRPMRFSSEREAQNYIDAAIVHLDPATNFGIDPRDWEVRELEAEVAA